MIRFLSKKWIFMVNECRQRQYEILGGVSGTVADITVRFQLKFGIQ